MKKENDPGFYAGIIYSAGLLASLGFEYAAETIWNESGCRPDDAKQAAEYDVAFLRRIISGLPKWRE